MKKILLSITLLLSAAVLSACSKYEINNAGQKIDYSNSAIVEENDNYEIRVVDGNYSVFLLDENGKVAESFGPHIQKPEVIELNEDITKIFVDTAEGLSWYYDKGNDKLSDLIAGVDAEYGRLVAIIDEGLIIVHNMFDESNSQMITEFSQEIDSVSEPIISCEFTEDGKELVVTYLNSDSVEVVENIAIDITE